jgi:hypothetical protein
VSGARSGERANRQFQDVSRATVCLSASVPALGRTRHPFAVSGLEGPSQKMEFVSLPVPKQFVESLGRVISFAQSAKCRTWQSAHFIHPVSFGSIFMLPKSCVLQQARSLSVAGPRQANTRPSSALRQVSPDCYFLFAFPGHKSQPFVVIEEPPWLFSESASPLSSAYATPRAPR